MRPVSGGDGFGMEVPYLYECGGDSFGIDWVRIEIEGKKRSVDEACTEDMG